jgi:RNA binding exosome subunit
MKALNKAVVSVFAREDEDAEKIKSALISLIPLDLEKEKIPVQQKTAKGFEEKKIIVYKIELEKTKHTNAFIKEFLDKLSDEQKEMLLDQAESRLDNHLHFFIRLDKTKLLDGKYSITESGECFHIKLHIAAFPSKRAVALEAIEKLLKPK